MRARFNSRLAPVSPLFGRLLRANLDPVRIFYAQKALSLCCKYHIRRPPWAPHLFYNVASCVAKLRKQEENHAPHSVNRCSLRA